MPMTRSMWRGPTPAPTQAPAGHRVRRRDERIGAVVEVEEGGLGALEQHVLAGVERLVHERDGVGDVRLEPGRDLARGSGRPSRRRRTRAGCRPWRAPGSSRRAPPSSFSRKIFGSSVAVAEAALEQRHGERVAELALDDPLERPGAEGRVEALAGQQRRGVGGDLEGDPAVGETLAQMVELDVDDAGRGRPR
jgi:hypothetical protein